MILAALLVVQAAVATSVPVLDDDAQLSCMSLGPGDRAPILFDLDFRSKRQANVVFAAAPGTSTESPLARVSSSTPIMRRTGGLVVIGFATGIGQYRLELKPQGNSVRLRLASVEADHRSTTQQGFCRSRAGKPLKAKPPVPFTADDADVVQPWKLATFPSKLPDATCRALTPDGQVTQFTYQVTATQGNELWTSYRFASPTLVGATATIGSGTQFHLTAPAERMVATTISLGGTPPTFLHVTYERQGSFLDLSRDGQVFAVGDCGASPAWILTEPGAVR